jgi:hypothetical protein
MSPNNQIAFYISNVKPAGSKIIIEGRCTRGPIVLGDSLMAVSEMTVQTDFQTYGPTTLHHVASVQMKVDSIWAYDHQLKELSQAMTARLELSGAGIEYLQ